MTLQELKSEVVSLCDLEKGKLAEDLLSMIKPSDYWVTDEEALERVRQLETGEVQEITFSELKKRIGR
jgi:hypothetical protein